jgi:hypothetical protein
VGRLTNFGGDEPCGQRTRLTSDPSVHERYSRGIGVDRTATMRLSNNSSPVSDRIRLAVPPRGVVTNSGLPFDYPIQWYTSMTSQSYVVLGLLGVLKGSTVRQNIYACVTRFIADSKYMPASSTYERNRQHRGYSAFPAPYVLGLRPSSADAFPLIRVQSR